MLQQRNQRTIEIGRWNIDIGLAGTLLIGLNGTLVIIEYTATVDRYLTVIVK